MVKNKALFSSFRDPSGFIFFDHGRVYRQINASYFSEYACLMKSGLYDRLIGQGKLIPHQEISKQGQTRVIQPELINFISYPYEWSFSMLKDAALATLEIQKTALDYMMSLKDASAYNIQFIGAKPVLIDTLSFEKYQPGMPWVAYQQFCRHFLAPLVLMSYKSVELGKLLQVYLDGIPLDLAAKLLPFSARLNFGLLIHLFLHAGNQQKHAGAAEHVQAKLSRTGMLGLIENLRSTIEKLTWRRPQTEWGDYYGFTNYSEKAMIAKKQLVQKMILAVKPRMVWDLGANTGRFSRLASNNGINTIAFDVDPLAVELNYLECRRKREQNLLPLIQNLTNPSSDIGFANTERDSLVRRGPADLVLVLALIHHLAISHNLPLSKIAEFLSRCGRNLVIEFVPKTDSQIKKLLAIRKDIFPRYTQADFEADFGNYFIIRQKRAILGTKRTLYLMKQKHA